MTWVPAEDMLSMGMRFLTYMHVETGILYRGCGDHSSEEFVH